MLKHKVLERTQKKVGFFTVEDLTVEHPREENKTKIYSMIHHPDWVNVVAETENGAIVLVEQWRAGTDDMSIECPGGKIDEGEEPIIAGIRELQEETGYIPTAKSKILYLGSVDANPAIQNNKMHYVFVNNVEKLTETNFDEFENVYTHLYDRDRVVDMLSSGAISHSYSVLALYKTFKG